MSEINIPYGWTAMRSHKGWINTSWTTGPVPKHRLSLDEEASRNAVPVINRLIREAETLEKWGYIEEAIKKWELAEYVMDTYMK